MLTLKVLPALAAFALVSSITPGPNNLMLMASGINFGLRRSIPHLLGVNLGFTLMLLLVGVGLHQIFDVVPGAHVALKILSVLYLVYLALKIAIAAPSDTRAQGGKPAARPMTFVQAVLFQWVNPKAWTMSLTACAAYVPAADALWGLALVAGVFAVINLPSIGVWAIMGVQLRSLFADPRRRRVFNIATAVILIASLYPVFFAPDHRPQ